MDYLSELVPSNGQVSTSGLDVQIPKSDLFINNNQAVTVTISARNVLGYIQDLNPSDNTMSVRLACLQSKLPDIVRDNRKIEKIVPKSDTGLDPDSVDLPQKKHHFY